METITKALVLVATLSVTCAGPIPTQLEMPVECADKTYCTTKHELYPTEVVEQVVEAGKFSFSNGWQNPLETRVDNDNIDEDCAMDTSDLNKLVYEVVDDRGVVRVVVQSSAVFSQTPGIKSCEQPGRITSETRHFRQDTVDYFNLKCVDIYSNFPFIVLTENWKDFENVNVRIPVGCKCMFGDED